MSMMVENQISTVPGGRDRFSIGCGERGNCIHPRFEPGPDRIIGISGKDNLIAPEHERIYFAVCIVALERCVSRHPLPGQDARPVEGFGKGPVRHQSRKSGIESGYCIEIVHVRSDERCLVIFVHEPECVKLFDFFNGSVALSSGRVRRAAKRVFIDNLRDDRGERFRICDGDRELPGGEF